MRLISHRGNINGPKPKYENTTSYILEAIQEGYDVEIDLRREDNALWLGHDDKSEKIRTSFLYDNFDKLWIHCKDMSSLSYLNRSSLNYFWHENDDYTITSRGWIWAYPGKQVEIHTISIAVLPEINKTNVDNFSGVCSDQIGLYK